MKKTNENLVILITLFAISIVIANVTGARTITTGLHHSWSFTLAWKRQTRSPVAQQSTSTAV